MDRDISTLAAMDRYGHEQVVFWTDQSVGLKAIVAIHSTRLGPALGGCRMWPYATEHDALSDVLRLAQAMTYKAAVAGVPLGGGKSVIVGDPARDKSDGLLRSFGRFIETLGGRYVVSEDVGTNMDDLDRMRETTAHVAGRMADGDADVNHLTALGTFEGMRAAAAAVFGSSSLAGRRVAVQGLGQVGWPLAVMLRDAGATLLVADVAAERVERARDVLGAEAVDPRAIVTAPCDVFAPCALGAVIDADTARGVQCRIVAGSANNVLAEEQHGWTLHRRDILLVPDYVINAGGLIAEACQLDGLGYAQARERVLGVHETVADVLARAEREDVPPFVAADRLARQRLADPLAV